MTPGLPPFEATAGHLLALKAHSSLRSLNNSLSGHPQIAQSKQRHQLRRVLGKPFVAHLGKAKLALDDPKRVLHLGPYAGLDLLGLVQQAAPRRMLIQRSALAWTHGNVKVQACSFSPLAGSLVARTGKDDCLLAIQKAVSLGDIVDIGGCADDGVHQARVCIHPNMRLHAKVPVITFLGLVHFRVALAGAVLGGTGRRNQGSIDYGTGFKHQAPAEQGGVDGGQRLQAELVLFKQVAKAQDRRFVRQAGDARIQPCKLAIQRHIVQGFFHGRVRQAKPLLHEVNAQHGSHRKGRAPGFAGGSVRLDQGHQISPGNHQFHFVQKFMLERSLGDQLETGGGKAFLFHRHLTFWRGRRLPCADLP